MLAAAPGISGKTQFGQLSKRAWEQVFDLSSLVAVWLQEPGPDGLLELASRVGKTTNAGA